MATMQDARRSSRQNLSHLSLGKQRQYRTVATAKEQAQIGRAIALLKDARETNTEIHFKYNLSEAYKLLYAILKDRN